jgi:hypothetical protein
MGPFIAQPSPSTNLCHYDAETPRKSLAYLFSVAYYSNYEGIPGPSWRTYESPSGPTRRSSWTEPNPSQRMLLSRPWEGLLRHR